MAVVKADGYGHGAAAVAGRLQTLGAEWFAVAIPEEGAVLRAAGITRPILCLQGFWDGQEDALLDDRLTPTIFSLDRLRSLDAAARRRGTQANYHLKLDTGMGRLGVPVDDLAAFIREAGSFRHVTMEGVLSHLASAGEDSGELQTIEQTQRFDTAVRQLNDAGFHPVLRHMANSAGVHAYPGAWPNIVRPGGILYGLQGDVLKSGGPDLNLKPVLSLRTRIIHLKTVSEGALLGYGATWRADRASRIATITIGYHDGYPRALSNCGTVLIRGHRAPVVGRVSMDLTLVDVSPVKEVQVGDVVTLIGRDGGQEIRAEEVARWVGTISYEIVCGIGMRVPRIVLDS